MVRCKIIRGDCLRYLKSFKDGSVDMVFTDPPYMVSSDIKIKRQRKPMKFDRNSSLAIGLRGREILRKREGKNSKFKGKDISFEFGSWDIFESKEQYREFTKQWFTECIRILRKGGHIISFYDKHKITYLVEIGEELNVKARQCPIWIKTNPVPCARKVNFMNSYEICFWGTKETTARKYATFNYELGQSPDHFRHSIVGHTTKADGERCHPTQKPIAFCEWLISYLTNEGDMIVDPFGGGGSVGLAALRLNRSVVLIEREEEYVKMMIKRVKSFISQQNLFKEAVKLEIQES